MSITETKIHPLVRAMPDGVLYGRGSSALIWIERHLQPGQVRPRLDDLARERQARLQRPTLAGMHEGFPT